MTNTEEIIASVDLLLRVHDEWESDPESPGVPTAEFERAVEGLRDVLAGDIPGECKEVEHCGMRFLLEWDTWAMGTGTTGAKPAGSFWGAFRALKSAREGAKPVIPVPPEPVALLLEQKVSPRQIALHIYGDGKTGPLVGPNGEPDMAKIMQEAREPGSIVPKDWIHPDQLARMERFNHDSRRRLKSIKAREEGEDFEVNGETVEGLLREGQYPGAVARYFKMDIAEVMQVANRLREEGVAISEMPNLAATRAPQEPEINPEADKALQPAKRTAEPAAAPGLEGGDDKASADRRFEACAMEVLAEVPDKTPTGEILAAIRARLGDESAGSIQRISTIRRRNRERATA